MSRRAILIAAISCPGLAFAQEISGANGAKDRPLFVNDEWERYARVRQIAGDAPLYPWTIRAFNAAETRRLTDARGRHPWSNRAEQSRQPVERAGIRLTTLDGEAQATFNSAFPFGYNDGPVWAGRGLTTSLSGGAHLARGPATLTLAPMFFRSENQPFALGPSIGPSPFSDAFMGTSIDTPQRFGAGSYQRLAPGNSRVELTAFGVTTGFGTHAQHWGPARDHPLILGNNAGGFPHAFLGSSAPVDLWIGKAHTRLMWGRLDATPYRPASPVARSRFATGIALALQPRGVPGLEVGFSRFFHLEWRGGVVNFENVTRPFIGVVRDFRRTAGDTIGNEPDNQIASLFARWVLPRSGVEVYAEFGKEDYNKEFRDITMEPDHISGVLYGIQRVLRARDSSRYHVVRGEFLDTRLLPLAMNRPEGPFYAHAPLTQGHTHDGQVLGSAAAPGGGAAVVAVDRYDADGRTSITASRMMRAEFVPPGDVVGDASRSDVFYMVGVDGMRFRGRIAATFELTAVYEANRHFQRDAFNLRASTGVRYAW